MVEVNKLNGKKVITADAFNVGEVSEVVVDDHWKINYIHVKLTKEATKEFGLRKPALGHFAVCLPVDLVQRFAEVVTLKASKNEFRMIAE